MIVPRCAGLTRGEFYERFASTRQPVIVSDAADNWSARRRWTWTFLRESCGADEVTLRLGPGEHGRAKLGPFINYVRAPESQPIDPPPYLVDWDFRRLHPDMAEDFATPSFVDDWLARLPDALRPELCWVFIGPDGSRGPLHVDVGGTHAWLTQLIGHKRWVLYPPESLPEDYCNVADAFDPDLERHPRLSTPARHECVLAPGETLFVPGGWRHQVQNIGASLALTSNYVDASNWAEAWRLASDREPIEALLLDQGRRLLAGELESDALALRWCRTWVRRGAELVVERGSSSASLFTALLEALATECEEPS